MRTGDLALGYLTEYGIAPTDFLWFKGAWACAMDNLGRCSTLIPLMSV